jgi:hypothetical protein
MDGRRWRRQDWWFHREQILKIIIHPMSLLLLVALFILLLRVDIGIAIVPTNVRLGAEDRL